MKKIASSTLTFYLCLIGMVSFGQLNNIEVAAINTDNMIDLDFTGGDTVKHQIFLNQSVIAQNKLLLFLPGTGAKPKDHYSEFCKTAANVGYHAIGLVYKNAVSISDSCGTIANNGPSCSENARSEIIYGTPLSSQVNVDSANSIMNRLSKLLYYLETNYPTKGWDNYIDTATMNIHWERIALAGHSQGGGHAALIARDTVVNRVLFFNSPSDRDNNLTTPLYQPQWFYDGHITHDSVYYAFYHQQNGGPERLAIYNLFGLGNYGVTMNVDLNSYPYNNSHILYTDSTTFDFNTFIGNTCDVIPPINPDFNPHSDIIVDCELALDNLGNNPFEIVWEYMLNNSSSTPLSIINHRQSANEITIHPNPTNGKISIDGIGENSSITIYSSAGMKIKYFENHSQIDLSNLPSGFFLLHILDDNTSYVKKVLKTD